LTSQTKKLPKKLKTGYKNFLTYIFKFYFSEKAVFSVGYYTYFNMITKTGNFSCSTSASESINHQLKTAAGAGYLSFDKSCRVLRDFKINYLLFYEDRVRNDNLNRRRKEVLIREKKRLLDNFYDLSPKEQISSAVQFDFSIGTIKKFVSLSQNMLNNVNFIPVVTTEADLETIVFSDLTFDSEIESNSESDSDSDSEF
jgi:hypothetical protein